MASGKGSSKQPLLVVVPESKDSQDVRICVAGGATAAPQSGVLRLLLALCAALALIGACFTWNFSYGADFAGVKKAMYAVSEVLPRASQEYVVLSERMEAAVVLQLDNEETVALPQADSLEEELQRTEVSSEDLKPLLAKGKMVEEEESRTLVAEVQERQQVDRIEEEGTEEAEGQDNTQQRMGGETAGEVKGALNANGYVVEESGTTTVTKAAPGTGRTIYVKEYVLPRQQFAREVRGEGDETAPSEVQEKVTVSSDDKDTPVKASGVTENGVPWTVRRIPGWDTHVVQEVAAEEEEEEEVTAVKIHVRSRRMGTQN